MSALLFTLRRLSGSSFTFVVLLHLFLEAKKSGMQNPH